MAKSSDGYKYVNEARAKKTEAQGRNPSRGDKKGSSKKK